MSYISALELKIKGNKKFLLPTNINNFDVLFQLLINSYSNKNIPLNLPFTIDKQKKTDKITLLIYIVLVIPIALITLISAFPIFIFILFVMILFNYFYKETNKIVFNEDTIEIYNSIEGEDFLELRKNMIIEIKLDYYIFKNIYYFITIKTENGSYRLNEFQINKLDTNMFNLYQLLKNWAKV